MEAEALLGPAAVLAQIPESFRARAKQAVLDCLSLCKEAGTLGTKGKHQHPMPAVDLGDNLVLSTYWTRPASGVKVKRDGEKQQQIAYFSRPTPCCGTNIALVALWVFSSDVKDNSKKTLSTMCLFDCSCLLTLSLMSAVIAIN